jgi:hypothetical protein
MPTPQFWSLETFSYLLKSDKRAAYKYREITLGEAMPAEFQDKPEEKPEEKTEEKRKPGRLKPNA